MYVLVSPIGLHYQQIKPTPSTNILTQVTHTLTHTHIHTHLLLHNNKQRLVCKKSFSPWQKNSKTNIVWVFLVAFFLKIAKQKKGMVAFVNGFGPLRLHFGIFIG